jgi:hypothetical protein
MRASRFSPDYIPLTRQMKSLIFDLAKSTVAGSGHNGSATTMAGAEIK